MTASALDLSLPRLVVDRLRTSAPAEFDLEAAAATGERAADLTAWLTELRGIRTLERTLVVGESTPPQLPAVTAHLLSDDFNPDLAPQQGAVQRASAVLAVVHVVPTTNWPRSTAGDALDPLEALVGATRAALRGWRAHATRSADALALSRGRLLGAPADGRVLWQDEYVFRWVATR